MKYDIRFAVLFGVIMAFLGSFLTWVFGGYSLSFNMFIILGITGFAGYFITEYIIEKNFRR